MAKSGHSGQIGDSAQRILDVAERLVQTRGFTGSSYADIAEALDVTKASLHYHFPSKADLGRRLIERYEQTFLAVLKGIDATGEMPRRSSSALRASTPTCWASNRIASVRHARLRLRCAAEGDEGGREALLRRERAVARRSARAGPQERSPRVQGAPAQTTRTSSWGSKRAR